MSSLARKTIILTILLISLIFLAFFLLRIHIVSFHSRVSENQNSEVVGDSFRIHDDLFLLVFEDRSLLIVDFEDKHVEMPKSRARHSVIRLSHRFLVVPGSYLVGIDLSNSEKLPRVSAQVENGVVTVRDPLSKMRAISFPVRREEE